MKSIAIVATQVILASIIVALGVALLADLDFQPQRLLADQLGDIGRPVVGATEVVAGVCLMLPRGQVIGTLLLAILTVGVMGMIIGRSTQGDPIRFASPKHVAAIYSTDVRACDGRLGSLQRLSSPRELAI